MNENFSFFSKHKRLISIVLVFLVFEIIVVSLFYRQAQLMANENQSQSAVKTPQNKTINTAIQPTDTKPINEDIKNNPAKAPIKPNKSTIKSNNISGTSVKKSGGGQITTVSEGPVSDAQKKKITDSPPSGDTPYKVNYYDDTGKYTTLGDTLKEFLASKLKWGAEISSLHGIEVVDAGDTGWAGQYVGSYTTNSSGEVTAVNGWISLNVYYYKTDPNFNDYMKLVLSHEYGHHYSLYYKWTKWDLLAGTRFPDDYYYIRPLSKTTTAADYSLGWENCEAEIIAEDYSYIYSGFGYQAMSGKYGYPSSPATANWLAGGLVNGPSTEPVTDNPPSISITTPANNAQLTETVGFTASASDDIGVVKVSFYVGDNLIYEDNDSPYETTINTLGYNNGNYTLKAIAYDTSKNTQSSILVTFNNQNPDTEKPIVTINQPISDPYAWPADNLQIDASATDNIGVVKIEIYINDFLAASEDSSHIVRIWPYSNGPAGTYVLKVKVYDAAGNIGEKSIVINKS